MICLHRGTWVEIPVVEVNELRRFTWACRGCGQPLDEDIDDAEDFFGDD